MAKRLQWTPELVSKFWDGIAQSKLDDLSFGKSAGPKFLKFVEPFMVAGGRHLDFGAGSGHMLKLMLDQGYATAGYDVSAKRQGALLSLVGDHKKYLGTIGFDSREQYDVVLALEVIEHILDSDFDQFMERIVRFIKPGGCIIVSTPNSENLENSNVYCPVSDTLFHRWQHVRSFTPRKMADIFSDMGLVKELMALADFSAGADDAELLKAVSLVRAQLPRLPSLVRRVEELSSRYSALLNPAAGNMGVAGRLLGFLERFKAGASLALNHRRLFTELVTYQAMLLRSMDALASHVSEVDKKEMTAASYGGGKSKGNAEVDLRIGAETTIVYIGRKPL